MEDKTKDGLTRQEEKLVKIIRRSLKANKGKPIHWLISATGGQLVIRETLPPERL